MVFGVLKKISKSMEDGKQSFAGVNAFKERMAKPDAPCVVFYSELGTDRIYYDGILSRLIKDHGQTIAYLTSSQSDPYLTQPLDGMTSFYIGNGTARTALFLEINAPVMVMTMPDLNAYHLKRSHNNVHYVYLFHSLVSTHRVYRDKAFNGYDTLFCVGPHQEPEIREAEKLFNLPEKKLIAHGYPRIDKIMADYKIWQTNQIVSSATDVKSHVLIAPSWGEQSISTLCADESIQVLLEAGYRVTYRPHPMTLRDEPEFKARLINAFGKNEAFVFDDNIADASSLFEADVMISDWSGVAIEFGLGTQKPVVFIDVPAKTNNEQSHKFKTPVMEEVIRDEIGRVCPLQAVSELPTYVETVLNQPEFSREKIEALRQNYIYNAGQSDEVGARELMAVINAKSS